MVLSGNSDGHQPDPGVNPGTGGARQALNGGLPNTVEKRMRVQEEGGRPVTGTALTATAVGLSCRMTSGQQDSREGYLPLRGLA